MRRNPVAALALVLLPLACIAQTKAEFPPASLVGSNSSLPPRSWVDKDTGHRVWRLSDEPNSGAFYFNINAYTPDDKQMVYSAPDGIHVLDLATRATKLLVANPKQPDGTPAAGRAPGVVHILVAGHKTSSVFYTSTGADRVTAVYEADTNTGAIRRLAVVPHPPHTSGWSVVSVNADETLIAGTYVEGDDTGRQYGSNLPAPPAAGAAPSAASGTAGNPDNRVGSATQGPHYQPPNKSAMMVARLAAKLPLVLFTLRLEPGPNGEKPGDVKPLLHSTDWVNHLLFSPTDPALLMYCHEGIWQDVDRLWMIHTDGTHNIMVHKRTMYMEIWGHEFWGPDGETIWYQWAYPRNADSNFIAGYNVQTGKRFAYHTNHDDGSIHVNVTKDLSLFAGDGSFGSKAPGGHDCSWIMVFHPQLIRGDALAVNEPDFWQPGTLRTERLVNMEHHNYHQEPNVRFTPDNKMVVFTANLFGPSYVFGVEIDKAIDPPAADIMSTTEIAKKFNPVNPPQR